MTTAFFLLLVAVVVLSGPVAYLVANRPRTISRITSEPRAMVPVVGVIGVLFGLFISFTSSDVSQRATSLQLALDRELSAARSLIALSTGIGRSAEPVRGAVFEYLQPVVSREGNWLDSGGTTASPADAAVSSLALLTTVFAEQGKANAVLKSLMMSRVKELVAARTERITRTLRRSERALWLSLTMMAVATQLVGAFALSGSRMQMTIFLTGYTFVAVVALAEFAWADRLVGPSRITEQMAAFRQLLEQSQQWTQSRGNGVPMYKLVLLVLVVAASAGARAESEILRRVKASGFVNIGYNADQFPFSYEGADKRPTGYSIELCRRMMAVLQKQVRKEPIEMRFVPVARGHRMAMVANGTVDIYCALSTENTGRYAQIEFLEPIFIDHTRIAVASGSKLRSLADIGGKKLAVISGTSNVQIAMNLNKEKRLGFEIVPVKDVPEALEFVATGAVDGYLAGESLAASAIAKSPRPDAFRLLPELLEKRPRAFLVSQQDTGFREAANTALRALIKSGEFERIYQRWFLSPVEPGNLVLNLEMSPVLRQRLTEIKSAK